MYRYRNIPDEFATNQKSDRFTKIRLVATDMDGTLTRRGKFTPALLQALEDLTTAGFNVLIITGRSTGWVSGLAYYLPVVGAIAENGGLFYPSGSESPIIELSFATNTNTKLVVRHINYEGLQIPDFFKKSGI